MNLVKRIYDWCVHEKFLSLKYFLWQGKNDSLIIVHGPATEILSPILVIFLEGDFCLPVGAVSLIQIVCHMTFGDFGLYANFDIQWNRFFMCYFVIMSQCVYVE